METSFHLPTVFNDYRNLWLVARKGVCVLDLAYNVHALNDSTEGRESLVVEKGISLVSCIKKYLSGSAILTRSCKDNGAPRIGNLDGIIWQTFGAPPALDVGITVDPELGDEPGQDSKDAAIGKESFLC